MHKISGITEKIFCRPGDQPPGIYAPLRIEQLHASIRLQSVAFMYAEG